MRAFIDAHFLRLREDPEYLAYFVLLAGSVTDRPLLREPVTQAHESVWSWIASTIQEGVGAGEFSKDTDVEYSTGLIGSTLLGIAIHYQLRPSLPLERMREDAYRCLPVSEQSVG